MGESGTRRGRRNEYQHRRKWYDKVNVNALDNEVRFNILSSVKNKLGFNETCKGLNLAKSSLHRYLSRQRSIPGEVVKQALKFLEKRSLMI